MLSVHSEDESSNLSIIEGVQRVAAAHEVELSLRCIVEPSLESLFLDVTGRRLRDAEGPGAEWV